MAQLDQNLCSVEEKQKKKERKKGKEDGDDEREANTNNKAQDQSKEDILRCLQISFNKINIPPNLPNKNYPLPLSLSSSKVFQLFPLPELSGPFRVLFVTSSSVLILLPRLLHLYLYHILSPILMLKRKMKAVAMESSPSQSQDQSRSRKFHTLLQDYTDLFEETEEKRKKINLAKRRRRVLAAEVRFLRQRYEELMRYKSGEQQVVTIQAAQPYREVLPVEKRGRQIRDATFSSPAPVLDLNQIANDDEEEIQGQDTSEPARTMPVKLEKNQMRFLVNKSGKPPLPPRQKDMKLTICRDIRKGSKTGKRKISLQDPVALRV